MKCSGNILLSKTFWKERFSFFVIFFISILVSFSVLSKYGNRTGNISFVSHFMTPKGYFEWSVSGSEWDRRNLLYNHWSLLKHVSDSDKSEILMKSLEDGVWDDDQSKRLPAFIILSNYDPGVVMNAFFSASEGKPEFGKNWLNEMADFSFFCEGLQIYKVKNEDESKVLNQLKSKYCEN